MSEPNDSGTPRQKSLVEDAVLHAKPVPDVRTVATDLIHPSSRAKADSNLVKGIQLHGQVLVPIMVCQRADKSYEIVDGNRRFDAARRANLGKVPVRIVDAAPDSLVVLGLGAMLNTTDSPNEAHEASLLAELREAGCTESDLAEITCMKVATVRERLRTLDGLWDGLKNAYLNSEILPSVAKAASRLDHVAQERLYKLFVDKGKLTAGDVAAEKRVNRADELEAVPMEMPGMGELTPRQRLSAAAHEFLAAFEVYRAGGGEIGFGGTPLPRAVGKWLTAFDAAAPATAPAETNGNEEAEGGDDPDDDE